MTLPARSLLSLLALATLASSCGSPGAVPCPSPCDGVCSPTGHCLITLDSQWIAPGALALDATSVYFTTQGVPTGSSPAIVKVPKAGGTATTPATMFTMPWDLAVDATSVYWTIRVDLANPATSGGTVKSAPVSGAASVTLASDLGGPEGIAVDAANVYFTEGPVGRLSKLPLAGGTPTVLASGLDFPSAVAVDADNIYWVESGTSSKVPPAGVAKLMKMPLAGGAGTSLATFGSSASGVNLAVDAHNVYWTVSVYGIVNGSSVPLMGEVLSVPIAGGAPTTLASGQAGPRAIAVDATAIYWINEGSKDDGAVMKLPLAGGKPVALATGRTQPTDIAVDGTAVYWTESGPGGVMKTSKD
jgi:hypothetical protein